MNPAIILPIAWLIPVAIVAWYIFGCPFPFINIGCRLHSHKFKHSGGKGMGEIMWFGHFDEKGNRKFKYVPAYEVICKRCGLTESRLTPNTEDLKYAKAFLGEEQFNKTFNFLR